MLKDILLNILDIVILSYICYKLIMLIKGTRAVQILLGIVVLGIATAAAMYLKLETTFWVLKNFWAAGVIIVVVVFQPDIRTTLAQLGSGKLTRLFMREGVIAVKELIQAVHECSNKKIGMLIVVEKEMGLKDIIEKGVNINGEISHELLQSIFYPKSPLHDGAVIISGSKILAAACVLPSTDNPSISKFMGMRHRAAIGVTEISDAFAIVVSEETGAISIASGGRLNTGVNKADMEQILLNVWKRPDYVFSRKNDNLREKNEI